MTIQFESQNYTVKEGAGTAQVCLTKDRMTAQPIPITFKAQPGTASQYRYKAVSCLPLSFIINVILSVMLHTLHTHASFHSVPSDYNLTGLNIFRPSATRVCATIPIIDDSFVETKETFRVEFTVPPGVHIGMPSTSSVTIIDNDSEYLVI